MSNQSPISKAQEVPANAATVAMPKTPCGKGKWFQDAHGNLMNPVNPAIRVLFLQHVRLDFTVPPMNPLFIICQDVHPAFNHSLCC